MQISSRFTIALHILTALETFKGQFRLTSQFLSGSIQVNPVVIRNILLQLKAAGFVQIPRGHGSITLLKSPDKISLLDVYKSIEPLEQNKLFSFHKNPNPQCPVGRNIHKVLDGQLQQVQRDFEDELKSYKVSDVIHNLHIVLNHEKQSLQA